MCATVARLFVEWSAARLWRYRSGMSTAPEQSPTLEKRDAARILTRERVRIYRGEVALAIALTVCAVGFTLAAFLSTRVP